MLNYKYSYRDINSFLVKNKRLLFYLTNIATVQSNRVPRAIESYYVASAEQLQLRRRQHLRNSN